MTSKSDRLAANKAENDAIDAKWRRVLHELEERHNAEWNAEWNKWYDEAEAKREERAVIEAEP